MSLRGVICTYSFALAFVVAVSAWLAVYLIMAGGEAPADRGQCLDATDVDSKVLSALVGVCDCVSSEFTAESFYNVSRARFARVARFTTNKTDVS